MVNDEVVNEFLLESYENLDRLERDLVALEATPRDKEILSSIFRTVHTIKGTSSFLAFERIEKVSHAAESLLAMLRDGTLNFNRAIGNSLLALVDTLRRLMANVESTGAEGEVSVDELIAMFGRLRAPLAVAQPAPVATPESVPAPEAAVASAPPAETPAPPAVVAAPVTTTAPAASVQPPATVPTVVVEEPLPAVIPPPAAAPAPVAVQLPPPAPVVPSPVSIPAAPVAAPAPVASPPPVVAQEHAEGGDEPKGGRSLADSTVRVDVTVLDRLMNLVGELVLARNQILQHTVTQTDPSLLATSQRINALTTELQEGVMKTRMQPIDNVWSKFPRVVRDVSGSLEKQVKLEMEGRETELDKTIIEAIRDPLTHLLRNAIDHGIERPDVRVAAGKPAAGRLQLRAYHEGGQVNIEIVDDGAGISAEKIKRKALEKGLVSPERIARMSDRDIVNLIFMPGFSTAEKVTNVSGRGVGMDVVKTNIEKIGGTVDVHSRPGNGSTFKLKIPLTLAIVPALMVGAGGDRFAIPQVSLLELVRLEREDAARSVEFVQGVPVYRLRGNLLPLVYLSRELSLPEAGDPEGALNVVVLQADGTPFGLVVDEIRDTEEIVVKPLGKLLSGLSAFAGATIMGDGRVALILDVLGLSQRAGIAASLRDSLGSGAEEASSVADEVRQTVLVFRVGASGRMALPLSEVARLEEIPADSIESLSGRQFVQYRGGVMPLAQVSRIVAPDQPAVAWGERIHIVVHARDGINVGLVVDGILDIVEEPLRIQTEMSRPGVVGCAVVQGRVTEVLSVADLVASTGARLPNHSEAA